MKVAIWLVTGVALAGCLQAAPEPPEAQVCAAICACRTPLDRAQELCAADCEEDLAGFGIPDACVVCAQEAACVELDDCLSNCFAIPSPAPEEP